MRINMHYLSLKSKEKIFGDYIHIDIRIPSIEFKKRFSNAPDRVMADFSKIPAEIYCYHGTATTRRLLTTLVEKKILMGHIDTKNNEGIACQLDMINFKNAIQCFKTFYIDANLAELDTSNSKIRNSSKEKYIIPVNNAMGKSYINGLAVGGFDEYNILYRFKKTAKIYPSTIDSKNGTFIKEGNFFYEIDLTNMDRARTRNYNEIYKAYSRALLTWNKKVDTSGSIRNKSEILRYLDIGKGFIAINHRYMKDLQEGRRPKAFYYRDAFSNKEKLDQPINLGTSQYHFIAPTNEKAIVVGYSVDYVDQIMKDFFCL